MGISEAHDQAIAAIEDLEPSLQLFLDEADLHGLDSLSTACVLIGWAQAMTLTNFGAQGALALLEHF